LLAGIDAPFSESTDPPPDLPAAWHERPRRGLFVLGPADQAIGPARQRELLEAAAEWSRRRDLKTLVVTTPGARCNTSAMAKRAESHPEFIAVTQATSCAALQGAARGASAVLLADGDGAVFRALLGSGRPVWLIPARWFGSFRPARIQLFASASPVGLPSARSGRSTISAEASSRSRG